MKQERNPSSYAATTERAQREIRAGSLPEMVRDVIGNSADTVRNWLSGIGMLP